MGSGQGLIWVDGHLATGLPLPDRGLNYGDGLFETLLLIDGKPLHIELHFQRLQAGLDALGFPDIRGRVAEQFSTAANAQSLPGETAMRITVTRGGGPRGYAPPEATSPRIIIESSRLEREKAGQMLTPAHLSTAKIRWGHQPALAGIKHLNRLEQVLAAAECQCVGSDEAVMLDQNAKVISVSAGNLFIVCGTQLITPTLEHCGIHGTRRRLIMERLPASLGLQLHQTQLSLEQLESADEVFYCNTLVGARPVASFGSGRWSSHDVCAALHQLIYREAA